jgi:arylamine N-acetyltransferase
MNTPGTVFLTILRCQLWQPEQDRGLSLVNNSLAYRFSDGTQEKLHLADIGEIEAVIADEFRLPKLPVREAVGVLESLGVDIFVRE